MAACSWLSESIRKFAEVTMRSPAFRPFQNDVLVACLRAELHVTRLQITRSPIHENNLARPGLQELRSRE